MTKKSLTALATAGVRALWERRKFTQKGLADKAGIPASSVNRVLQGTQPVTLSILDAVGELTESNPLELLVDPSDEMKLVNPDEARLLRYFRNWPRSTRTALLDFAQFFADEDPVTSDQRRAHEQLRRLAPSVQRRAYAYLLFLSEGGLTPDLQEAFGLTETADDTLPLKRSTTKKT